MKFLKRENKFQERREIVFIPTPSFANVDSRVDSNIENLGVFKTLKCPNTEKNKDKRPIKFLFFSNILMFYEEFINNFLRIYCIISMFMFYIDVIIILISLIYSF